MKRFLQRIHIGWFALLAWSLPHFASAACSTDTSGNTFTNPLNFCTLSEFVQGALQVFVMIMLPVIAFFIVLAGFNFVWARGNPAGLQKAKMNFLFVIIGTCLMLGAWLLANLIGATVSQVTGG
ncbi:hypothetical protein C4568_02035 [Candidatus Parcubacteria bacterium]|nr:MAG: hypothetical protein C4568_02035 [Candidatus Parcubacteria bacterium]